MSDIETIDIGELNEKPSVNFGSGIELLMNDKKKTRIWCEYTNI